MQITAAQRAPAAWRCLMRLRGQAGVTLIEVLAATVILGIGLVGVGAMVTNGSIAHDKAATYTIAAARASEELERIREAGYLGAQVNDLLFPSAAGYAILDSSHVRFTVNDLKSGSGMITLVEDAEAQATNPSTGQPYSNLKKITVDITWSGGHSTQGSYQVVTLLANRP